VAVLKTGFSPAEAWAKYPVAIDDPGDPPPGLQFNPLTNLGNHAPAGSGAPGACGDAATPCPYDGSDNVVDGASPTDGQHHFRVAVNAPAGSVVDFVCLVHAGMQGSVKVVDDEQSTTSPHRIDRLASRQLRVDTAAGFAAEHEANDKLVQHKPEGTRLVTLRAGANAGKVELFEMLPSNVRLHPGDQVQWRYTGGNEIHTVTFPDGTDQGEPLVPACEGTPDTDFVPPSSGPPCGDASKFELHLFPQPFGTTIISSPTTFGSSGLIAAPGDLLPSLTAEFTFPNAGTFTYFCHIHDHMTGTLTVATGHGGDEHGDDDSHA
jgi:plastocyanin